MKIRVFATPELASVYAASIVEQVIERTPQMVLGCATGGTMVPFYAQLTRLHAYGLDLSQTVTVNLDEYIGLAPTHPQSYQAFMTEHLWSKTNIPAANRYIPNGMAADLEAECARYDAILQSHPVDLQLLGIGHNGHIGFNEPSDLLQSKTHVVALSPKTVASNARFFANEEEVPRQAITMGVQAILQAKQIVLMAFGADKADIVAKIFEGEVRTDVPASILQLHRDVTVILDEASASALTQAKQRMVGV